ncbi:MULTISPECIES: DNA polymerase III subunit alpha [unclassified Hyphomonas]|jgi:DNA polymerase-3 subunit alpha|uniref:DNA polymerase III subunit alpha n=7 Tax=Hyphomonas TaxID=85 RepID=UPI0039C8AA56|tara:strand:- start:7140 stop:10601 length:3462 start_codon:yes stop_codon:yes gene_type:complete
MRAAQYPVKRRFPVTESPFIHLAVRSSYSLLESMITPKGLKAWCVEQGMPAVAITDRNNLYGALEISLTLTDAGIQPIMACCFDVTDGMPKSEPTRVSLYAQNEIGYKRLMLLSSRAYLDAADGVPKLSRELLLDKTDGLILLTGGAEGEVARHLLKARIADARTELSTLASAYPGRCYVEITRHGTEDEYACEEGLIDLAYELGLPLVATHDARFMKPSDAKAHDAMMCISNGQYLGQEDRKRVDASQYLKTAEEMRELFADIPEAIANTFEIAQRCAVKAETHQPILPNFSNEGRSESEELRKQALEGLEYRLGAADKLYAERDTYFERLDYELTIIERMGFPGYFLIVSDFIKWAKDNGIPVGPGRGSGAGSLVAWVLLITDLDPLRFDLLFERFLNPERVSMPDFDIDFCQERRGEVIRYVRDKYGADSVAMIITFGTLQAKAVVRDVGRVMQMPYGQVDRLAKLIPFNPANPPKLQDAIDDEPKFQDEIDADERVGELLEVALSLEGKYRNAGTHAAGVVIGDRPLVELVPLYNDPRADLPATQFNMKYAEMAGLVKFDFLGLKTLTVIDRALKLIRRDGRDVGPEWQSLDDQATYDLMASGETLGVFQLEGAGMRDTLKKVRPHNLEDVIAIISLYRPGPMENIPVYVQGKEDPSSVVYQHPDLKPVLEATYGVPVYQEQVMRMAQEIAGYSLGEADLLRRAMGKKKVEEMIAQRKRFVEGAAEQKGMEEKLANDIFDTMEKFAGYGFNKSHAAAYALIGYHTGYLKRHFPVEFLAASMSLDIGNTDKLAAFFQEAKRLKIPVLAPDVNTSSADFDVRDGAVVYALGALKGVGLEAMKHVVEIRDKDGRFADLYDFAERVDPKHVNKKAFESLSKAGAFDGMEPNRARMLESAPLLANLAVSAAQDRQGGQGGLFAEAEPALRPVLPKTRAWNGQQKLDQEFKSIGFYFSGHPLDDVLEGLDRERVTLAMEVQDRASDGKPLEMIGVVRARSDKPARNGGKFAFLTLSDPSGEVEMMVFPETLSQNYDLLQVGNAVAITVGVKRNAEEIKLNAERVLKLEAARLSKAMGALKIRLAVGAYVGDLAGVVGHLAKLQDLEQGELLIEMPLEDGRVVTMKLPATYTIGLSAQRALKEAPGVERVEPLKAA